MKVKNEKAARTETCTMVDFEIGDKNTFNTETITYVELQNK